MERKGPPMTRKFEILILGASYGSLLATKLAMAGHHVTLVCLPHEADLINREGTTVRFPIRGRAGLLEVRSRDLSGGINAEIPPNVDLKKFDLVVLAMQEPQYASEGIRHLMSTVARSKLPTMSIMNMPPMTFLRRMPALNVDALYDCYAAPEVWDRFDPDVMTLCSPDPQAFRPPDEPLNLLQVTLPTQFQGGCLLEGQRYDHAPVAPGRHRGRTLSDRRRFDRGSGEAESSRVTFRTHGKVGDASHRKLSLRAEGWRALNP
jgi:hypothetical protein